jgi:cobalt-zinc-cadmium resistance protein CzcA
MYRPLLEGALRRRYMVIGIAVAALLGSLAIVPQLGSEFLPELNEGAIWVNLMLPPGISLSEVSRTLHRVRSTLTAFAEVNAVISQAGRPEDGTDPKPVNMAELFVDLKPQANWRRKISKEALIEEMNQALEQLPNRALVLPAHPRQCVESISQIDGQIVVKLFSDPKSARQNQRDSA